MRIQRNQGHAEHMRRDWYGWSFWKEERVPIMGVPSNSESNFSTDICRRQQSVKTSAKAMPKKKATARAAQKAGIGTCIIGIPDVACANRY